MRKISKKKIREPLRIRRLQLFFPLIAFLMLGLELRLVFIQGSEHEKMSALAHRNRISLIPIPAPRGDICDRNGRILVYNEPTYSLSLTSGFAPIKRRVSDQLAAVLQVNPVSLAEILSHPHGERLQMTLRNQVSLRVLSFVAEHQQELPGIQIIPDALRRYPLGDIACHVLGYIHSIPPGHIEEYMQAGFPESAQAGWSGVEKAYDHDLRGVPGKLAIETLSEGDAVRRLASSVPAQKGKRLVLTIDSHYQQDVQTVLARQVQNLQRHGHANVKHAMAVALDPRNGEILALASYPYFHPEWMVRGMTVNEYQNHFVPAEQNWATQVPIAPGSVMKPLTALFAFSKHVLYPSSIYSCSGAFPLPKTDGTSIHCWSKHGAMSLPEALAESCDIYFYKLSLAYSGWPPASVKKIPHWLQVTRKQTLQQLQDFQRGFGLGARPQVDLPDAEAGYINTQSGQVTDMPYTAIGQNEVFTALELADYIATLANHGVRVLPHVVKSVGGVAKPSIRLQGRASHLPNEDWQAIIEGLYRTCNAPQGTAFRTFHNGRRTSYTVAGKTGTAETGISGFDNAVFVGYAPFHHPRIAIAIVVPGGGHGADSTGPIARALFDDFFVNSAGKYNSRVE